MSHVIKTEKKTSHSGLPYYQLHIVCPVCKKTHYVLINAAQYSRYTKWCNSKELIQNLLPDLSDAQRESLITGFCKQCQDNFYGTSATTEDESLQLCSICGKVIDKIVDSPNNAAPFKGICCDECNSTIVVNTRIALLGLTVPYGIFFDTNNSVENVFPKDVHKFTKEEIVDLLKTSKLDMFKLDEFVVIKQHIADVDNRLFNECFEGQCLPQKGRILVVKEEYLA